MVRGSILTGDVDFERVTWRGSRGARPAAASAVGFFAGRDARRESLVERPRCIAGGLGAIPEVRFEDAVVAFRKRYFYDHNDDVRACPRLIDADSAGVVAGREVLIVTKHL